MTPHQQFYDGPANWLGSEIRNSGEWHFNLTTTHVDEVKIAVQKSIDDGIDIVDLNARCFELPTLGPELARLYQDVVNGRGFFVGHGIPVDDFNREEVIRAWIGIGTYLGDPLPQNAKGHIIGHVKDLRRDASAKNQRTFGTSERQPYHTDNCDIVGLLCLKTPKSGGLFSLTSSYAVYNEMLKRRPDLVAVPEQPFIQDRRGEVPDGKQDTYEMAAYYHHRGRLLSVIDRNYVNAGQAHDDVPRLTRDQIDALDLLEAIAEEEGFYVDLEWSPGTFAFVHNHQMFHSRTAYEDYDDIDLPVYTGSSISASVPAASAIASLVAWFIRPYPGANTSSLNRMSESFTGFGICNKSAISLQRSISRLCWAGASHANTDYRLIATERA